MNGVEFTTKYKSHVREDGPFRVLMSFGKVIHCYEIRWLDHEIDPAICLIGGDIVGEARFEPNKVVDISNAKLPEAVMSFLSECEHGPVGGQESWGPALRSIMKQAAELRRRYSQEGAW